MAAADDSQESNAASAGELPASLPNQAVAAAKTSLLNLDLRPVDAAARGLSLEGGVPKDKAEGGALSVVSWRGPLLLAWITG